MQSSPVHHDVNDLVDGAGGEGVVVAELLAAVVGDDPEPEVRPRLEAVPEPVRGRGRDVEHHHAVQARQLEQK